MTWRFSVISNCSMPSKIIDCLFAADGITYCSVNLWLYSSGLCIVISSPKKRCPYVLLLVFMPAISKGMISVSYKATSHRIGRIYRMVSLPHRIVLGNERSSMTFWNEGNSSYVFLPVIFLVTNIYGTLFTSFV